MYEIFSEDTSISDLDTWLAFGDITEAPIDAGWIHPYQRGSASIQVQGGELTQAFDIQSFLVDLDDLDPIFNAMRTRTSRTLNSNP